MFSKIGRFFKAVWEFVKPLEVEIKRCYRQHVIPLEWDLCPICEYGRDLDNKKTILGTLTRLGVRNNRYLVLKEGRFKLGKRPGSSFIIGKTNRDNIEANLFVSDSGVNISALNGLKVNGKFYTDVRLYEDDIIEIDSTRYHYHKKG